MQALYTVNAPETLQSKAPAANAHPTDASVPLVAGCKQHVTAIFLKPCEGGYTARVPDVPGCVTGGATIEECVEMARDALCGCLCVYKDEGVELAPQRPLDVLEHDPDEIAALIEIDTRDT